LLNILPVVKGLEIKRLLEFLGLVLKIRRLGQLPDMQLFEVLYPFCREPLAEQLLLARAQNMPFEQFHRAILENFIPRRLHEQLRQEGYARVQGEQETFALYVSQIREAAAVLLLPVSEGEIFENIIEGLRPAQRSRFVFHSLPRSFVDLDLLCVVDQNLACVDSMSGTANPILTAEVSRDPADATPPAAAR
jgi:hypothetical protein